MGQEIEHILLYDIYNYQVVPMQYTGVDVDDNYAIFINRAINKPINVFIPRIPELFVSEYEARLALEEQLLTLLKVNNEDIKRIEDERGY